MVDSWLCMLQVLVIAVLLKVIMKRRFSIIQVSALSPVLPLGMGKVLCVAIILIFTNEL